MSTRSPVTGVSVVWTVVFVVSLLSSAAKAQQPAPNTPSPQTPKKQTTGPSESNWPRTFANRTDTFTIYQPQVDRWDENLISLYCAVEVRAGKEGAAQYGVVWFQGPDRSGQLVTLDQAKVTKVKFPVAPEKGSGPDCAFGQAVAGRHQNHFARPTGDGPGRGQRSSQGCRC